MKIAIFTGYFLPHLGGVERYVDKLSKALQEKGHEIVIVTSNHNNSQEYEVLDGRKVYRLPIANIVKERYPIPKKNKEFKALVDRIEREEFDYVLLNTRFHLTSLVGAKIAKKLAKPTILVEHGTGHFTVGNKFLDFFGGIYEHALTGVVKKYVSSYYGVSKNCNEWLKHFHIIAEGVFYNSVSKEDSVNVSDAYADGYGDDIVITFAGRLIKEKGILNLLSAFKTLKEESPDSSMRLVVAGDGELFESIQEKYGNDPSIALLGRLNYEQVMALYKRSDIFVHPSLYPEGLPTVILEAGLMNNAVIATPRGGTEEVIVDSHHGIIVDGSIDSLITSMRDLVNDETTRLKMAQNVKTRIETVFDWSVVADEVVNSFKKLSK